MSSGVGVLETCSDEVKAEYDLVSEAISRLQMGLDLANASGTLEVDLLP